MNFYVSFLNNIALKIVANNIKYVWQLTGFLSFNSFYFYCNLFCYLLTYLFIYSFTLCCVLMLLICCQLKKISERSFFIYHLFWEFTYGFVQGKPNTDEYFWIRSSAEVRNDTESAWIIVEGSRSWKLDFPNICNLFRRFSKDTYNDYLLANVIDSFLLLFWQTKAISPTRRLRVSHLFSSYSFGYRF